MKIILPSVPNVLDTLYEKPCAAPVIAPVSPQIVALSDEEVLIWFFKPLTDQYDYQIVYNDAAGKQQQIAYWTTYGPVWADSISGFKPKGVCSARISLLCYNDKTVHTPQSVRVRVSLLDKCKLLLFCIAKKGNSNRQVVCNYCLNCRCTSS